MGQPGGVARRCVPSERSKAAMMPHLGSFFFLEEGWGPWGKRKVHVEQAHGRSGKWRGTPLACHGESDHPCSLVMRKSCPTSSCAECSLCARLAWGPGRSWALSYRLPDLLPIPRPLPEVDALVEKQPCSSYSLSSSQLASTKHCFRRATS